jgi:hypothetical protein
MDEEEKKRANRMLALVLVLSVSLFMLAESVKAPPVPRNVEGRVLTNGSNGVENGISVRVNSTSSNDSVLVYTDAPEVPELFGLYSLTIIADDGEEIIGFAWNSTHYGTNRTNVQSGTENLNIVINTTRPSEANVTILYISNDSLMNVTSRFRIFANVSIIGSDGVGCNATIRFMSNTTLNITDFDTLNHSLGNIALGSHKVTNWTVYGHDIGSANFTVRADCSSDGVRLEKVNIRTVYNITFQNFAPQVQSVRTASPLDLLAGQNLSVYCNATIYDSNSPHDIRKVNATLFQQSIGGSATDDNNNHYTNNSCANISSFGNFANYSCGFRVAYYANNGTWKCNISVADIWSLENSSNSTFFINELMAVEVFPSAIDHGNLKAGNTSHTDSNISIRNIGNVAIIPSVKGFAPNESLGYLNLSMVCPIGNISNNNHRYSLVNGTDFSLMQEVDNSSRNFPFTLQQRTNDAAYGNDTNLTHWKVRIPPLTLGLCNGTVVFGARTA